MRFGFAGNSVAGNYSYPPGCLPSSGGSGKTSAHRLYPYACCPPPLRRPAAGGGFVERFDGFRQPVVKGELLWRRQRRCNAGKIIGRSKNGISGSAWIKALTGVRCPAWRIGGGVQRCCPVSPKVSSLRKNGCRRTCRFSSPAMFGTPSWARVRLNALVRMSSALSMPARPAAPAP